VEFGLGFKEATPILRAFQYPATGNQSFVARQNDAALGQKRTRLTSDNKNGCVNMMSAKGQERTFRGS